MAQIPPGALAAALGSSWLLTACGAAPPPPPPPRVEVEAVQRERFGHTLDTVSTLEASEEVELAAQAGGRVLRILVPSGAPVRRGQLLLVLDQTQLQADVAALEARVVRDQLNYQRYQQLVSQGAASALQRD